MIEIGISNYTALLIADNPHVKVDVGGPSENGKYVGWIYIEESEETRYQPLLNTNPIFDTKQQAIDAMQKDVDFINSHKDEHVEHMSKSICDASHKAGIKNGSHK